MKRFWIIAGIVVGVIILAILIVPLFINVDSFRPDIEKKLSASLGRTVHIGKIQASLFSGGARADNISISDDPAFNKGPFLQASSLQIGLEWMPLIFSKQLKIDSLTVNKPDILLLKNGAGKWNYSSMGNSAPKTRGPASSDPPQEFSIAKFQIQDGKIRVAQTNGRTAGKEHVYEKVNLKASNISAHSAVPFTLTAALPGGGSLEAEGHAGPLNQEDAANTPLDARITLKHVDLAGIGFSGPDAGLGGLLDFEGTAKSDGHKIHSEGKGTATSLRLVKGATAARQPVSLDYNSDYALDSDTGTVNANVHTGKSTANASGTINSRGESTLAHLKITGKNMAVNEVEGLLPAVGVTMPSGASLRDGVINMNLNAEGPLDRMVITGPVDISGSHLSGFSLSSKLAPLAALTGLKPSADTLIQTFSSGLRVAPEGIRADNIVLDVPSLGQVTGNGIIGSNQALDFKMLLKPVIGGGGLLGQLGGLAGQNKGIPFLIKGTTANPSFLPSIGGLAGAFGSSLQGGNQQTGQQPGQGQQGLGGLLDNLMNRKKKKP